MLKKLDDNNNFISTCTIAEPGERTRVPTPLHRNVLRKNQDSHWAYVVALMTRSPVSVDPGVIRLVPWLWVIWMIISLEQRSKPWLFAVYR